MPKKHMIENFTPVLDTITEKLDLLASNVYGRVWRYCQMEGNKCFASQKKLADDLGVSTKTIERRLKLLVSEGYLVDLTPDRRHQTHEYKPTGKAGIRLKAEAYDETESPTSKTLSRTSKTESRTRSDSLSVKESNKKQNNKQPKKQKSLAPPKPKQKRMPKEISIPLVAALAGVTGIDETMDGNYGHLVKYAKDLWQGGYKPRDIATTFGPGGNWYKRDWRGKKKQKPTPADVTMNIKQYLDQAREAERRKYVEGKFAEYIER